MTSLSFVYADYAQVQTVSMSIERYSGNLYIMQRTYGEVIIMIMIFTFIIFFLKPR